MKLIIVRHGETDRNINAHLIDLGSESVPLNGTGLRQGEAVAKRLAREKIDVIVCSDLLRAKQTAALIQRYHPGLDIQYSSQLRERDSGDYAHRSVADRETAQQASGLGFRDWRPNGGESIRDVKIRAGQWLEQCRKTYPDRTVLMVSHGFFIFTLLEWAVEEGAEVAREKYRHHNSAVTTLDLPLGGAARVIHLNDIRHLR